MKCFLLDNQPERRESLKALLRQIDRRASFTEATDWQQTNRILKHDLPDLFVIDWQRNWMTAHDLLPPLRTYPTLPVAVLTDDMTAGTVNTLLYAGVLGIIPRKLEPCLILRVLQLVLMGGYYIPASVINPALPHLSRAAARRFRVISPGLEQKISDHTQLSPRQHQVMRFLHMGSTNKSIARALNISEGTVKIHLATIFRVLGAANRAAAVALYNGWQISKLKVLSHEFTSFSPKLACNMNASMPLACKMSAESTIVKNKARTLMAAQSVLPYSSAVGASKHADADIEQAIDSTQRKSKRTRGIQTKKSIV